MPESDEAAVRASPLAALHADLGARMGPGSRGVEAPIDYGSVADEHALLRSSRGIADRGWQPALELRGEDRVRFLNGLATCDVRELEAGEGCYGFFTDAKGKVLADVAVLAFADRLLLELPFGLAASIAEHLQKYVIADRVEIRLASELYALAVAGPTAGRALERLSGESPPRADWHHRQITLLSRPATLCRHPRLGAPGYLLWAEAAAAAELFAGLTEGHGSGELPPVGDAAMETVRVEEGIALVGADLDADTLPQETGVVEAVSYTKGCYLGQEIVARIHYRGQVNRQLRGLLLESDELPEPGAELSLEGRRVGALTSPTRSIEVGRPIALTLIHRKAADAGTRVEVEGGAEAEVAELPFVSNGVA